MKKILSLSLFVLALCAVSCQEKGLDGQHELLSITATIAESDGSRVTLTDNGTTLHPEWTVDDEVIGFDEAGNTFTFTVTSVSAGCATMSAGGYAAVDGRKVYAIYAPGKEASDISANQLAVDIATQDGILDETAPFLMCATATVDGTAIHFSFENKVAVVGLKKFKVNPVAGATTVDHLLLDGAVAAGTFQVVGDELALVPSGSTATITAAGSWETDASGIYDAPVYFAVLPTTDANLELHAASGSDSYVNLASIAQTTLNAGYYYRMSKILDAVAEVAGVKYDNLDDAWAVANAATSDVTVTLLANCTPSAQLLLNNTGSGAVTLDLNGKTITTDKQVRVNNGRVLTISDSSTGGAISSSYMDGSTVYANASTIHFTGGTLTNSNELTGANYGLRYNGASTGTITGGTINAQRSAVYVAAEATLTMSGGNLNSTTNYGIFNEGGRIEVSGGAIDAYNRCFYQNGDSLIITGGTFHSNAQVIATSYTGAVIYINGGYFSRATAGELITQSDTGKAWVNGGFFDRPVNSRRTFSNGGSYYRCNKLNSDEATKDDYPYEVGSYTRNWIDSVGSYAYYHQTFASAAKQAREASSDMKIVARLDMTGTGAVDLTNPDHTVTLDLKGHTIESTKTSLITTGSSLTIQDSGDTKGYIKSTGSKLLDLTAASANVTLNGVVIYSTKAKGSSWRDEAVINMASSGGTLTITDSKVYSTDSLSTMRLTAGTTTINNSEISSGTSTEGLYAIMGLGGTVIFNSGSVYTSGTNLSSTFHIGNSGSSMTINDGYFYSLGRVVSGGGTYISKINLNGGYYNGVPSVPGAGGTPTYGAGLEMLPLSPAATHEHETISTTLSYGYRVMADPGEGAASLDEPVANYGGAITSGINF